MISVPATYRQMCLFLLQGSGAPTIIAILSLAVLYKAFWGSWGWLDALIVCGFVAFRGIIEWLIHACLYHARPLPWIGLRITSTASRDHIRHHECPDDISTLLITYRGVLILSCAVFAGGFILTWTFDLAITFVIAFLLVGLAIEVVHLICHCNIPHHTDFMTRLVHLHRQHHWVEQGQHFGVTSGLGDRLFGTDARRTLRE